VPDSHSVADILCVSIANQATCYTLYRITLLDRIVNQSYPASMRYSLSFLTWHYSVDEKMLTSEHPSCQASSRYYHRKDI